MGRELTGRSRATHGAGRQTIDDRQETTAGSLQSPVSSPQSNAPGLQSPVLGLQSNVPSPQSNAPNLESTVQSLQSNSLGLRPKEFWAVNDVSFELKRGECLGLIGRNGAGKTTLLRMLNGLIKPDAGRIEMRGRVGALIALGAGFNPILTGRENIYTNASVLGLTKKETDAKLDEIIDFAEIGDFIDTPVQNYSSGMAVRLGFAVASSLSPDVLIIDEVLAVGDINFQIKCSNRIRQLIPSCAVIFVSHSMQYISWFCTRVMVIDSGAVVTDTENLAQGITAYMSFIQTIQEVSGTGEAEILEPKLQVGGRELKAANNRIAPDDELSLEFGLRISETCRKATLLVAILDEVGNAVVALRLQAHDGSDVQFSAGFQTIHVPIGTLELTAGKYNMLFSVQAADTKRVLIRLQGMCHFVVNGVPNTYAKFVRRVQLSAHCR